MHSMLNIIGEMPHSVGVWGGGGGGGGGQENLHVMHKLLLSTKAV